MATRRASRKPTKAHKASKKTARRVAKKSAANRGTYLSTGRPSVTHAGKLHVAPASSASEIESSLGLTRADIKAVLEAIGE